MDTTSQSTSIIVKRQIPAYWRTALIACLLACANLARADGTMPETARRYIAAMLENNPIGQAGLLADDATFEDPMGTIHGKEAILAAWSRQQVEFDGFERNTQYPSGADTFVLTGVVSFVQTFRDGDGEPVSMRFSVDCSIALTIRDGKVIRHVDYVDTIAFNRQLRSQIEAMRASSAKP